MTFQPGKSGNPGGRSREKLVKTALDMELARAGDSLAGLRKVWKPIVEKAWEGDLGCAKEIFDRRDGKAAQAIMGGDEDDPAIKIVHEVLCKGWGNQAASGEKVQLNTASTS